MGRKKLQELTIKDNFMFGAVMLEPENCRGLLELVLDIPIERIEVSVERSIVYHPEYKGVRLDVYARDEKNTHYNVEMQVSKTPVKRRSRYYQSQMDMELLLAGETYEKLPDTYVIFVCDYDPLGYGKYRYTIGQNCCEVPELAYDDGRHTVFLSTCGTNEDEVPAALVKFLKYVKADLAESTKDFGDDFIDQIQKSVRNVKVSREMEARYMVFQEMLDRERSEGRNEGQLETIIRQIQKKCRKGKTLEEIADEVEEPVEVIRAYYDAISANPDKTPEELMELLRVEED